MCLISCCFFSSSPNILYTSCFFFLLFVRLLYISYTILSIVFLLFL
nr:MAG TPA: hypothetical protein [Caudoviricetes sp.]